MPDQERISKYISYQEAIKSQTAIRRKIDNTPPADVLANMRYVAANIFDSVREHFGCPLTVSSFYRCQALNRAVGGSPTSDHVKGSAIDIDGDDTGVDNREIFEFIKNNLDFDQLINEYPDKNGKPAWVHVSLRMFGKNRKQVLTIR